MRRPFVLFVLLCLVWGSTWLPIKIGITAVPPLFFGGARFVTAGLLLLVLFRRRPDPGPTPWVRLTVTSLLIVTVSYALLFWGVLRVPTGVAATVNMALLPVGMLVIGALAGEERFARIQLLALPLGIAGLALLLAPWGVAAEAVDPLGLVAIFGASMIYCGASIINRRLLRAVSLYRLAGLQGVIGGAALILASGVLERPDQAVVALVTDPVVLACWLFLVLFGSLFGFTVFLQLLRDWGPLRAGLYAFVSPIVAVALGVVIADEPFGWREALASALLLTAAALALRRPGTALAPRPVVRSAHN